MLIRGTHGADEGLTGTDATDAIYARGGNDVIYGSPGGDTIFAGAGNDDVTDLRGGETVFAGSGNDSVFSGLGSVTVHGNQGADYLEGGTGPSFLYGDKGDDVLQLTSGRAEGGSGNDRLFAGDFPGPTGQNAVDHVELVGGRGSDTYSLSATLNDKFQTVDVLDYHQGVDHVRLWAGFADGNPVTGPDVDPSTTIASWLDATHDGVLDERDTAAGQAVWVDHAANTITLGVFTDNLVLHGATSLALTELG